MDFEYYPMPDDEDADIEEDQRLKEKLKNDAEYFQLYKDWNNPW